MLSSSTAPTVWCLWVATEALLTVVITLGGAQTAAETSLLPTEPSAPNTVNGCTESSDTRLPAPATGPAGTAQPPNSSVLAVSCTTRTLTPATGLRPSLDARNILSAKTMPTLTFLSASHASATGPAKEDIPVSRDVPPLWSSIGNPRDVSTHQLWTATFLHHPLSKPSKKELILEQEIRLSPDHKAEVVVNQAKLGEASRPVVNRPNRLPGGHN